MSGSPFYFVGFDPAGAAGDLSSVVIFEHRDGQMHPISFTIDEAEIEALLAGMARVTSEGEA